MKRSCKWFSGLLGAMLLFLVLGLSPAQATTGIVSYTYDDLNRLTQVIYANGVVVTYTYDEVGNRIQLQTAGAGS
jgi:YD repeat-containing protein